MHVTRNLAREGVIHSRNLDISNVVKDALRLRTSLAEHGCAAWKTLQDQGYDVNPCGSRHHPAVKVGVLPQSDSVKSLQEAYTPWSTCYGCGPSAGDWALNLRSYRGASGLEAVIEIDEKFCSFPGVVSGGAIATLFDCHGNWTAAVALMDEACLPRPPMTLTYNLNITYKQPTPPNTRLLLSSKTVEVRRPKQTQDKVSIEVHMEIYNLEGGNPLEGMSPGDFLGHSSDITKDSGDKELLVSAIGTYKRIGALRAL